MFIPRLTAQCHTSFHQPRLLTLTGHAFRLDRDERDRWPTHRASVFPFLSRKADTLDFVSTIKKNMSATALVLREARL
jgi:hypothetical protein